VTTVDTSGVKGTQAFSVANTLTAATLTLSGAAVATVTGTGVNDTINVTSTAAVTHVIDAGAGTADVVNIAVKTGFVNIGSITNAETINVTVAAGNSIDLSGASFATSARAVNILGGNSTSTFNAQTVVTEVTSVNAGTFGGKLLATFGDNVLDSTVTVTGGALATDQLTASYATAATYTPKTSGVEILAISASNGATSAAAYTVDLSNTTGVTRINASVGNQDTLTIDKATTQTIRVIDMQSDTAASTLEVKLADASGAADSLTFELLGAASTNIDDGAIIKTTDIETINLKVSSAESISLASLAMTDTTKFESLVVTGDKALTVTAINANVTSINASGMTTGGSFTQSARSQTTAANYVGSLGNDTFRMAHGNDVIDGAAGTGDTLVVAGNLILGGIQIDLSATGDQVGTFNGSANAAIQSGFENIDVSGITGTGGADITAVKTGSTITGTPNADQINGGAGADTINYSAGNDVVTGGAGNDTFQLTDTQFDNVSDASNGSYDLGAGTGDIVKITNALTGVDADFVDFTNAEILTISTNASTLTAGTVFLAAGFTTIDSTDTTLALTGSALGTAAAPLIFKGYTVNASAESFVLGGTDAAWDDAVTGWTIVAGLFTKTSATVADFYTAVAGVTGTAGEIAIFVSGADTYVYAEGVGTGATDDSHIVLTGVNLTSVSTTQGALVLHVGAAS
jgi:hypothetical protein